VGNSYEYSNATIGGIAKYHIYNWATKDVTFTNSTFTDAETGIESHDARNIIGGIGQGNTFANLKYGFRAFNTGYSFNGVQKVIDNDFENVEKEGFRNTSGQWGTFDDNDLFNTNTFQADFETGMYFEKSPGFRVTDNTFTNLVEGVMVNNSGSFGGIITDDTDPNGNIFDQCRTSNRAWQNNSRLRVRCNTYDNPVNANYDVNWLSTNEFADQGRPDDISLTIAEREQLPAGNQFNPDAELTNNEIEHFQSCPSGICALTGYKYYRHTESDLCGLCIIPNEIGIITVIPPIDKLKHTNNSCHLRVNCTQQFIDDQTIELDLLGQELDDAQNSLDQGNTNFLITAINSGMPNGALKNLLLSHSILSDQVIIALIERSPPLPPGNFKEIILANSPVSLEVAAALNVALSNLPPGIVNEIGEAQIRDTGVRTVTAITDDINQADNQRQLSLNCVVSDLLEADSVAEAITLLQGENTPEAERIIFGALLADGDLVSAAAVLNAFPVTSQEDQDWVDIQTIVLELAEDTLTVFEMDRAQEQIVRDIASQIPESPATSNAKSILRLVFGEDFPIVFPVPPQLKLNPGGNQNNGELVKEGNLTESKIENAEPIQKRERYLGNNYPDPFTNITYIPYLIPDGAQEAIINVYDITGKLLKIYQLAKEQNILSVKAENWMEGVYIYRMQLDGRFKELGKMVLIK